MAAALQQTFKSHKQVTLKNDKNVVVLILHLVVKRTVNLYVLISIIQNSRMSLSKRGKVLAREPS